MYIVPEPIEVKAIEKYKLYIKFENGEEKILDGYIKEIKLIDHKIILAQD